MHTAKAFVSIALLASSAQLSRAQEEPRQDLQKRVADLEAKVAYLERLLLRATGESSPLTLTRNTPEPLDTASSLVPNASPNASRTTSSEPKFTMPSELVPEIGKIGAEVGLLLSNSKNPWQLNDGKFVAGFIDLPLIDRPAWLHGKVSYEILVGMSQSKTRFQTTSNVAQVANLAVLTALNPNGGLSNIGAAVTGTGPAPFPVTSDTITKLRLLQVVPFSLKYTSNAFDRWRFRPYAVLGFGTYVTIHAQYPVSNAGVRPDATIPPDIASAVNSLFGGKAPFGGPLVAGQISQAPELESRGLPGGHGNFDIGIHAGVGFEYRLSRTLSLGWDMRYNRIASAPGLLTTQGTRIGLHF